jgi:6,7-dimethyl-8-ribityllumazine synthase
VAEPKRPQFAIVVGRFYEDLAEKLVDGATRVFAEANAVVDVYDVPGAYELPLAAKYAIGTHRYLGIACVGAVIRGETSHYDHVCSEAARGIAQVGLETGVPCAFGVLTVENMDQALARLGQKRHQGEDAARAVLQMARLRRSLTGVGQGL